MCQWLCCLVSYRSGAAAWISDIKKVKVIDDERADGAGPNGYEEDKRSAGIRIQISRNIWRACLVRGRLTYQKGLELDVLECSAFQRRVEDAIEDQRFFAGYRVHITKKLE